MMYSQKSKTETSPIVKSESAFHTTRKVVIKDWREDEGEQE